MKMIINNIEVELLEGETILEAARRAGIHVPSLCYNKDAVHKASCMACAVKDVQRGAIIPSCTTIPTDGMVVDTECDEAKEARRLSLELLLSDHKADCEAPCTMVCPKGLNVERFLMFYDTARYAEALAVLKENLDLENLACLDCKAPCEKACRRGMVDKSVEIRSIIQKVLDMENLDTVEVPYEKGADKALFHSRLGQLGLKDRQRLRESVKTDSRCLHCACHGRDKCNLRRLAQEAGIKSSRYGLSTAVTVMNKVHIKDNLYFEAAKCIRCGLCVYNSQDAFTFKGRGFTMEVCIPEESFGNATPQLASLCPTGAIYLEE